MVFHLDTNYLIAIDKPDSVEQEKVRAWLGAGNRVAASSIAWSEYLCGPVPEAEVAATRLLIGIPAAFGETARLFNAGGRRKGSLPDCQIAAVALRAGAMLATRNRGDFLRFAGLGLRLAE